MDKLYMTRSQGIAFDRLFKANRFMMRDARAEDEARIVDVFRDLASNPRRLAYESGAPALDFTDDGRDHHDPRLAGRVRAFCADYAIVLDLALVGLNVPADDSEQAA